ncbi:DEAD/DEAH box helicase [Cetobacterium sp.]|uniref:DEAD/DEAH box helicase n=1 Tax=Cetobacterium sp. TaxID=2071632 RepID=UPI002FCA43DE
MDNINNLIDGLKTSSVDANLESMNFYQSKLLSNKNEKIITSIREHLENCDEFIISVAFITESGITLLLEQLKKLANKNIKGKILTGDYLNFTQPKALKKLLEYENIELKILSNENFHAKGYFFKRNNVWSLIIGSSNLTQTALTTNFEWNLKVNSLENGKIAKEIIGNFNDVFNRLPPLDLLTINSYEKLYNSSREYIKTLKLNQKSLTSEEIKPNYMQIQALNNLEEIRKTKDKALLISATGTGKTYLSAFDVKAMNPKKVLFIAHRKTILDKSKDTYESLISNKKMCLYGEGETQENDYIFAMVQTLNRDEHLKKFSRDYFDYIIIDEVHHSGAKTYQNIINYFTPRFFLGMTATPERSDNFDIYKLFDHTIAFEIRLHDALKEKLLCPFHYFGISDIEVDGRLIDEKATIKNLVVDERVNHIIEKSRYYGYSGEKLHGLIFVSKVEEARVLSEKLNEHGLKTKALTGETSDLSREKAIEQLEKGELEYLITVDIFNEGVDIPCVNQVLLLRPTDSAIVYIQQLGRGLRKSTDKEFVVILDFIGNYEKNFLIPIAISQNNSYDKDSIKRFINRGTEYIPGESSIVFEEIVKERIFENISKTNFSTRKNIEHDYKLLKKQLGRTPYLNDFFERNMIDPSIILKYKKDYDDVLKTLDSKGEFGTLNAKEKNFLKFLSSFFTPAKRIHEIFILKYLLKVEDGDIESLNSLIENEFGLKNQILNTDNALKHLTKDIFKSLSTAKEFLNILEKDDKKYRVNKDLKKSYEKNFYFKMLLDDLISYNLNYVKKNYQQLDDSTILKYKEYSKQEAFWYLNLDFNNGYQVSGYTAFEEEKKVMIFITADSDSSSNYNNEFFDQCRFTWFSKTNRCLSRNNQLTTEGKISQNFYTLEIFIKKISGEKFYYMGQVEKVLNTEEIITSNGDPLVKYELKLKDEIELDLFNYLTILK